MNIGNDAVLTSMKYGNAHSRIPRPPMMMSGRRPILSDNEPAQIVTGSETRQLSMDPISN